MPFDLPIAVASRLFNSTEPKVGNNPDAKATTNVSPDSNGLLR
ncbi:hypothetical protein ACFQ3W_21705 [Paenibacillus puldeungensis]|uniref:Uncharacterized protein n=1 Tax=Paenibacillus puldeungensis TaxID=696536 RepID=A0ABW3S284_9BACL